MTVRGGELVGARALAAPELERRVDIDQTIIDRVGQHRRARGLHEPHAVLRVPPSSRLAVRNALMCERWSARISR